MTRQYQCDNQQPLEQQFTLAGAGLSLWSQWLSADDSDEILQILLQQLPWSQDSIMMFGKPVAIPRYQVWMGEHHCIYRYSGTTFRPQAWHPLVKQLTENVSAFLHRRFNCVLLNAYHNGQHHMGWHADNEPELGHDPAIASLSLGASRRFELRHRQQPWQMSVDLTTGSLLLMSEGMQHSWQHRLPKQSRVQDCRINLTFRYIGEAP